jgi:hypothetical protein
MALNDLLKCGDGGRTALIISSSALAENSSLYQKAASSAMTAT